ncbi:hypothetical protein [Micromonospora sp. LOL_023]|uniref:hypothetical protein n=1 Tax=Micromonospora sp. LOL_023 TaxID=3345418 RepID=UPI003A85EFD3
MVGILGIGVAVALARRQRAVERMHADAALADQRDRDAAARRERVEQATKVGRRDSWRIRFEKIDGVLDQLVDVASRVLNQGPCTSAGFTTLDLEDIQMRAERLAGCGIAEQLAPAGERLGRRPGAGSRSRPLGAVSPSAAWPLLDRRHVLIWTRR